MLGSASQLGQGRNNRVGVSASAPCQHVGNHCLLHTDIDREEVAGRVEWRDFALGEGVDANHDLLAALDAACALGHRADQSPFQFVDRGEGTTQGEYVLQFRPCGITQLGSERLNHVRPIEQVVVLKYVALVRQHLLHTQRPLLVPRTR